MHFASIGKFFKDACHDRFNRLEHIFLRDKAHFNIELIELAWRSVGPRIFIAKAWRDLEIAVKACHHNKLLKLLGRLRQGVKFTGVQTRRHQEVARAFGRAGRKDWRLKLCEAAFNHTAA